jgi:uncharacterized protein YbbC (DUF1343 family)
MRSLNEATLYPGVGLLETTNVSVGRGTDTPFELVGAPWINGPELASYLNGRRIPGIRFVPTRFTPTTSVFKGIECGGVNLIITNRVQFRPVSTGLELAVALRRLYPNDWKVDDYLRLLANADVLDRVKRGDAAEDIVRSWGPALDRFEQERRRFLLYQ